MRRLIPALLITAALSAAAETGVTENTILIGQTVGLTGIIAAPVKEMNEGANAYFSLVNMQGGVHGRKIEILRGDGRTTDQGQSTGADHPWNSP